MLPRANYRLNLMHVRKSYAFHYMVLHVYWHTSRNSVPIPLTSLSQRFAMPHGLDACQKVVCIPLWGGYDS